ncbi:hypothetical protein NJBCHELONAE_48640 [Mycobacteroides chelonae]|uniref:hypothetical protein n=1 Tax=Mycobacteroides chelonae TaxID=1774 RepID=UPI0021DBE671|nr:hypothetical protein [Mycobacteroides chelonae]GLE59551.1 hypothetical protein NJBCHELONAE_48640 [Mycobacteroides chelonae]
MSELAYFTVTGRVTTLGVDYVDADTHPDELALSVLVDFFPRVKAGKVLWCSTLTPPRGISLRPMRARFDTDGVLKTIQGTSVELLARNAALPLDELIYDVVFSRGQYNGQDLYIEPFAFQAPTSATTIDFSTVVKLDPLTGLKPIAD